MTAAINDEILDADAETVLAKAPMCAAMQNHAMQHNCHEGIGKSATIALKSWASHFKHVHQAMTMVQTLAQLKAS